MKKIICLILFGVIAIASFLFYQHLRVSPTKTPIFADNPQKTLTDILVQDALPIDGPIITQGTTLKASISGLLVLFTFEKDLNLQARALQLILPRLKMESKLAKEVDLRFNKIVIRY